jgi:hypothetical protein
VVAAPADAVAEGLGEPAFADPDRAAEDDVLVGDERVQKKELAHTRSILPLPPALATLS